MTLDHLETLAAPFAAPSLDTYRVTYRSPIGRLREYFTKAHDGDDACDQAVDALQIDYGSITRAEVA